jgi:hypothetical protein
MRTLNLQCCETLIANLKSDAGAWASLQSTLVCALCDLGFPAEELDDLRSHLQTPVSFVRYKADARVMLSVDERQTWCAESRNSFTPVSTLPCALYTTTR